MITHGFLEAIVNFDEIEAGKNAREQDPPECLRCGVDMYVDFEHVFTPCCADCSYTLVRELAVLLLSEGG